MHGRTLARALLLAPALATAAAADGGVSGVFVLGLYLAALAFGLVEFFLLPGFGVAGGMGLLCFTGHAGLLLTQNPIGTALGILAGEMVFAGGVTVVALRALPHTALGKSMIHQKKLEARSPTLPDLDADLWIGRRGTTAGSLRPAGTVWIDDQEYPARARKGLIDDDTAVEVCGVDGKTLVVKPVDVA